jgi:putative toxin-antitoxin system antitoxin component (TIGR02293 family)
MRSNDRRIESGQKVQASRLVGGPTVLAHVQRVTSRAEQILGSHSEVAHWFRTPAMGLDLRRPIDLLWTDDGVQRVETLLTRLEYGVYT